jgi:ABC-2 type transport system ATP-binding protein
MAPINAVEVHGITKKFGEFTAVDNISFSVATGETFGFLGPNGAGKTTLIRILTTLLRPTSGDARVAHCEVIKEPDAVRREIGVVPQAMTSDLDLTGYENMDIYGRFYDIPANVRRERIAALLATVDLTSRAQDLVATYSGGMRRRLEIARVLVHKPQILFLDEPTIGLDPQSRRVVWDFLRSFKQADTMTIFLTTHYMDEAEEYCDRVAIIDHGKIIAIGSPAELKAQIPGNDMISLKLSAITDDLVGMVRRLNFVSTVIVEDNFFRVGVDNGAQNLPELLEKVKTAGGRILSTDIHEQSLNDVFLYHTGKEIRDETKKVSFLIGAGIPQKFGR